MVARTTYRPEKSGQINEFKYRKTSVFKGKETRNFRKKENKMSKPNQNKKCTDIYSLYEVYVDVALENMKASCLWFYENINMQN